MALTNLELGNLYAEAANLLGVRFSGSALKMAQQIFAGGYPNPTASQVAWSTSIRKAGPGTLLQEGQRIAQWGLANNITFQGVGTGITDGDMDYIVAECAKVWS
jgi:hypothetical protein